MGDERGLSGPSEAIRFDFGGRLFLVAAQDLLAAPVDAIVNAANGHLAHGGGVAALIARRAGQALEDECRAIIRMRGALGVSEAVLTTAGDLPYRGVIHVVGPRAAEGDVPAKLEAAVGNAIALAEQSGFASIAFPAVSTGIFGVDKETCARAFHEAVGRFFRERPRSRLREIWLCLVPADFPAFEAVYRVLG